MIVKWLDVQLKSTYNQLFPECPDVVGWEKDDTNALGPRRIDLSSQMDPLKFVIGQHVVILTW